MISINAIEIISTPPKIYTKESKSIISNSISAYLNKSSNDGMKIVMDLKLEKFKNGNFYINQICTKHILKIKTTGNIEYGFNNKNNLYRDTPSEGRLNYRNFQIENFSFIESSSTHNECNGNKVIFFDAPFLKLSENWLIVDYYLSLQTWFQFKPQESDTIYSLLSFEWMLSATVKNNFNGWILIQSDYSTVKCELLRTPA